MQKISKTISEDCIKNNFEEFFTDNKCGSFYYTASNFSRRLHNSLWQCFITLEYQSLIFTVIFLIIEFQGTDIILTHPSKRMERLLWLLNHV